MSQNVAHHSDVGTEDTGGRRAENGGTEFGALAQNES